MDIFKLTQSKTRGKILGLFFANPEKKYYLRELERILGVSVGNIRRELLWLEREGVFQSEKRGNLLYYFLNKNHSLYKDLKNIVFKTIGIEGSLREALRRIKNIESAFIYGSFAKGEEDAMSDVDLFIVGNPDPDELLAVINKLEKKLQREINYTVMGREEFVRKQRARDTFLKNVLEGKKVILIGNKV